MRAIGAVLSAQPERPTCRSSRRYRARAVFIADPRRHYRPLDRNQRAKLLAVAEGLERASKLKGRRCGVLGQHGLAVLRALVFGCLGRDGRCDPTYRRLQELTGFARATIAKALRTLEELKLLTIIRRLTRRRIVRTSPITGELEEVVLTTQASSLYIPQVPTRRSVSLPDKPSSPSIQKNHNIGFQDNARNTVANPTPELRELGNLIRESLGRRQVDWRTSARLMFTRA